MSTLRNLPKNLFPAFQGHFKVIRSDMIRSDTYNFLLVIHCNYGLHSSVFEIIATFFERKFSLTHLYLLHCCRVNLRSCVCYWAKK